MHSTDELLKVGTEAVKNAEKIILDYFGKNIGYEKKSDNSPVTLADKAAEKIIRETISKKFPDHNFCGEEGENTKKSSGYLWTIDPIDGTRYFTRGLPHFSTLLSLSLNGKVLIAFANIFQNKSLLTAIKDRGAYINNKNKLRVSETDSLNNALIAMGSIKHFDDLGLLKPLIQLNWDVSLLRSPEESKLYFDFANGDSDAVMLAKGYAWDFEAPELIFEEAGAVVSNLFGKKLDYSTNKPMNFLAANPYIHKLIVPYFSNQQG